MNTEEKIDLILETLQGNSHDNKKLKGELCSTTQLLGSINKKLDAIEQKVGVLEQKLTTVE